MEFFSGGEGIAPASPPVPGEQRSAAEAAPAPAGRLELRDVDGNSCAHCDWPLGSDDQKWTCTCGKAVHLGCFGKCASSFQTRDTGPGKPVIMEDPEEGKVCYFHCPHCGRDIECRYKKDPPHLPIFPHCKYCLETICFDCAEKKCPTPHTQCAHCTEGIKPFEWVSCGYCQAKIHADCEKLCPNAPHVGSVAP